MVEKTLKKICLFLGVPVAWAAMHFYDKNILVSISCVFVFILLIFIDTVLAKRIREKELDEIESYLENNFDILEKEHKTEFIKQYEELYRSRKF